MADLILEIVEGKQPGLHFELGGTLEVGRANTAILLDDDQVSRRHARISPSGRGALVEDLDSSNGTYVNDQPIHGARELVPGDRIRFGLTVVELRTRRDVATQPSVVGVSPQITTLGQGVLREIPELELPPARPASPAIPTFLVDSTEPAFVPRSVADGPRGGVGLCGARLAGRPAGQARHHQGRLRVPVAGGAGCPDLLRGQIAAHRLLVLLETDAVARGRSGWVRSISRTTVFRTSTRLPRRISIGHFATPSRGWRPGLRRWRHRSSARAPRGTSQHERESLTEWQGCLKTPERHTVDSDVGSSAVLPDRGDRLGDCGSNRTHHSTHTAQATTRQDPY